MTAVLPFPISTFAPGARITIRGEEWLIKETEDSPSIRLFAIFAIFGNFDA